MDVIKICQPERNSSLVFEKCQAGEQCFAAVYASLASLMYLYFFIYMYIFTECF